MSFPRCFLSSALLAGVVFSALTVPLSAIGSKPVAIQLEEKPVFVGEVKELAAPYLGLATVISVGAGMASLAMSGWRKSARKLSETEDQVAALKKQLQEKDAAIESLKFSDSKLESSGLHSFLEEETENVGTPQIAVAPAKTSDRYTVVQAAQPKYDYAATHVVAAVGEQGFVIMPQAQASMSQKSKVQASAALSAAQAFMGYARPVLSETTVEPVAAPSSPQELDEAPQIDELLSNLKQMMSHIEKLHVAQPTSQGQHGYSVSPWPQQVAS